MRAGLGRRAPPSFLAVFFFFFGGAAATSGRRPLFHGLVLSGPGPPLVVASNWEPQQLAKKERGSLNGRGPYGPGWFEWRILKASAQVSALFDVQRVN